MAMLAEPRRRSKYSVDPRGQTWAKDDTKFGQKLMEKMGWSKGKGLGSNEDGNVELIGVTVKNDQRGVGCSKSHADNWIAHQDDFNALLSTLQESNSNSAPSSGSEEKVSNLESKSKASKGRVHYMKFAKGKDLSMKKAEELDCIFGRRKNKVKPSTSNPSTPQTQSAANTPVGTDDENSQTDVIDKAHGVVTVKNELSVGDYFAKKMAAMKEKLAARNSPTLLNADSTSDAESQGGSSSNQDASPLVNETESKKKAKSKKSHVVEAKNTEQINDIQDDATVIPQEQVKKKKTKKTKKNIKNENDMAGDSTEELRTETKRKRDEGDTNSVNAPVSDDNSTAKNKRHLQESDSKEDNSETKTKKKKSKKNKRREDKEEANETVEDEKKRKKNKKQKNKDETICEKPKVEEQEVIKKENDNASVANLQDTKTSMKKSKKRKLPVEGPGPETESTSDSVDKQKLNDDNETYENSKKSKKKRKKNNSKGISFEDALSNQTADNVSKETELPVDNSTKESAVDGKSGVGRPSRNDVGFKGSNLGAIAGYAGGVPETMVSPGRNFLKKKK